MEVSWVQRAHLVCQQAYLFPSWIPLNVVVPSLLTNNLRLLSAGRRGSKTSKSRTTDGGQVLPSQLHYTMVSMGTSAFLGMHVHTFWCSHSNRAPGSSSSCSEREPHVQINHSIKLWKSKCREINSVILLQLLLLRQFHWCEFLVSLNTSEQMRCGASSCFCRLAGGETQSVLLVRGGYSQSSFNPCWARCKSPCKVRMLPYAMI